jgi:hypothetical protein
LATHRNIAVNEYFVLRQFCRMAGFAMLLEVIRARANTKMHTRKFARYQARILQFANPYCQIYILFNQVNMAVAEIDIDLDITVVSQKFADRLRQLVDAKAEW